MYNRIRNLLEQVILEFNPNDKKPRKRFKKILRARDSARVAAGEEAQRQQRVSKKLSQNPLSFSRSKNHGIDSMLKVHNRAMNRGGEAKSMKRTRARTTKEHLASAKFRSRGRKEARDEK